MFVLNINHNDEIYLKTFTELGPAQFVQLHSKPVVLRCPHCGSIGTFYGQNPSTGYQFTTEFGGTNYGLNLIFGSRLCPNPNCSRPIFVVEQNGSVAYAAPPQTIDFDTSNVPSKISDSLKEAIVCLAVGCFRASALMIRRTLEEICDDKNASGDNLKKRIESLSSTIVVPSALIAAIDQLRILGNDAAHVEAKTYDSIGKNEIEIGIILCKEFIKATYQLDELVSQLKNLGNTLP